MIRRFIIIIVICLWAGNAVYAGFRDDLMARGYVRYTPLVWKLPNYGMSVQQDDKYIFTNLLNVRQNFRYYASSSLTVGLELKERAFLGESANDLKQSADFYTADETLFDWDIDLVEEDKAFVSMVPDRAWLDYMVGDVQVTVGRQRVAWGVNTVWNPTDLFNPSSPLDFDNEEMPGTDAFRVQYYLGPMSKLEAAVSPKRDEDKTIAAAKLQLNKWDYDWTWIIGRRYAQTVAGFSWAGDVHDAGFKGEVLYAFPRDTVYNASNDPYASFSISVDYGVPNTSLYLHSELLYNELGTTKKAGGLLLYDAYNRKQLSPSRLDVFGEVSYTFSPIVTGNLNVIYNPYDQSFYVGPNLTVSVHTNVDLTLMGMVYQGEDSTEFGDNPQMVMGRLKWNW